MPSSNPNQISQIMEVVLNTKPESVLDIGVGFGKYGFLCREYLELWDGREVYNDWQRRIDGIEVFEGYITCLHEMIYNNIYIGDALHVLSTIHYAYDLILLIDVLEHFSADEGQRLLQKCTSKGRNILVATPKNIRAQGAAFGNEHETHKFQWRPEHFKFFNKFFNMSIKKHPSKYIMYFTSQPSHSI